MNGGVQTENPGKGVAYVLGKRGPENGMSLKKQNEWVDERRRWEEGLLGPGFEERGLNSKDRT